MRAAREPGILEPVGSLLSQMLRQPRARPPVRRVSRRRSLARGRRAGDRGAGTSAIEVRDGVLFVDVASNVWMQELGLLRNGIVERLNACFGRPAGAADRAVDRASRRARKTERHGNGRSRSGMTSNYTADGIQVLKGLEAVRKRPAMYIGGTGSNGLASPRLRGRGQLPIDEALGRLLRPTCRCSSASRASSPWSTTAVVFPSICIRKQKRPALEVVMTMLHAGGKFDKKSYKVSGGLHGVGVSVVNALVRVADGRGATRRRDLAASAYERGIPDLARCSASARAPRRGTTVAFMPDKEIFESIEFSFDTLSQRLRELAFLNNGVRIDIEDQRGKGRKHEFRYEGGIKEFVTHLERQQGGAASRSQSTSTPSARACSARSRCSTTTPTSRTSSRSRTTSTPPRAAPISSASRRP
jgi:hypothetical protein